MSSTRIKIVESSILLFNKSLLTNTLKIEQITKITKEKSLSNGTFFEPSILGTYLLINISLFLTVVLAKKKLKKGETLFICGTSAGFSIGSLLYIHD